jgi:hypothetical protein
MANPVFSDARIRPIDPKSISRFMDIAGLSKLLKRQTALPQHCRDVSQNVWLGLRKKTMSESLLPVGQSLHPVEDAIIRMALQLPVRPNARALDLWNLLRQLPATVVHLQACDMADGTGAVQTAASNALARLVRGADDVQRTTPTVSAQSTTANGCQRRARVRYPQVPVLASTLLEVLWAGNAGAPSGREVYRLAWLPSVDKWVVTSATDFGVHRSHTDHLLAAIEHQDDVWGAACQVISQYWRRLRVHEGRGRWAVLRPGRIDSVQAAAMADAAWPTVARMSPNADMATKQDRQAVCC